VAEEKATPREYVVDAELIDALEGTVNRLQQENDELRAKMLSENVKLHGFSSEGDKVIVAGNSYAKQEFDRLMSSSYVQNEEQQESGKWKEINSKISEEEYIALARKQNDNSNNAS
jgi:hypothetical protein